jgi:hypothetical protein
LLQEDSRKGFADDDDAYGGDDAYDDDGNINFQLIYISFVDFNL